MSEFKPITTQEEFDKAIQERLNRQKETIEKQYADYAEIKARNQELETEVGTLKAALAESNEKAGKYDKDISELNAKIAGYETANLKTKIALELGIPYNLAGRLVGDDEKAIRADAESLSKLIKTQTPPPLKSTEPTGTGEGAELRNLMKELRGE
jgi:septal ring factor EnvC (AmiA/AmiB activator)